MRLIVLLVAAVLAASLPGCAPEAEQRPSTEPTLDTPSAPGTADGLSVVLSLPSRTLVESSTVTATIAAANSTESAVSTIAIFRFALADSSGDVLLDAGWFKLVRNPQEIGPGDTYIHEQTFRVPSPGQYWFLLPEVEGRGGQPLRVEFESVKEPGG